MLRRSPLAACILVATLSACPLPTPPPEPPHFLWSDDPQSLANPFPDERLVHAPTLRPKWYSPFLPPKAISARSAAYFNKIAQQFSREVDATGGFGATLLPSSAPLAPATLAGTVARLVKGDDGQWQVLERNVPVLHLSDVLGARGLAVPEGAPEFLTTRPTIPLPEGHDGLLVVLAGAKTTDGLAFGRAAAWDATKPDVTSVATALGVAPADVLFTLPQRAPSLLPQWRALAQWAAAHPPAITIPAHAVVADENNGTRPVGLWTPADSDWSVLTEWVEAHDFARPATHVGRVVVGELATRDLRNAGVFDAAWVADPAQAATASLRFVLSLPAGPKPAGGWTVVMGQHGVGGRNSPRVGDANSFCLEWAEPLAARGLGCIGIDAPNHGSRGTFTSFFTVDDLPALRDRMREMTFDLLQVEAAVATLDVDGDGAPDLRPQVRYFGNSMGAIMGSAFVPVSNHVTSAVLNVPGAGLSNVVMSHFLQDLIGLLIVAQTDIPFDSPEYVASFPLFRAVAQPLFDPGDPINFASAAPGGVSVLLQAGVNDKVIPMDTSVDLARALHLTAVMPGNRHAFMQADAAKYLPPAEASTYNGHNVMWDFAPIREQALTFLETDGLTLTTP
ncbi:MAG: hypothetical protein U0228_10325 [Myxococcaceae bacterium]